MMSCDDALLVDETVYGNLTSSAASGEISAASDSDPRIEIHTQEGFYSQSSLHSFASPDQPPLRPPKKKRSLPGNPDPDAEVIALSPGTLMAANRFMCEICNKGFQRDQNLQLHRRGHNLPWKLKQRGSKEVMIKKKVYVCPEPTCVHHDPSRALGDLTGVKKHFCRKHGDKKWKCDKCSKRYAVQSDLKAHSKICGTREYKCDCGTIFSRRDSFITHRAFCDALAENTPKPITNKSVPNLHLSYDYNNVHSSLPPISNLETLSSKSEPDHFLNLPWTSPLSHIHNNSQGRQVISGSSSPILFDQESLPDNPNPSFTLPHHHHHHHFPNTALLLPPPSPFTLTTSSVPSSSSSSSPHIMSATALLQKAAQMGVTMSKLHHPNLSSSSLGSTPQPQDHHQHHHMRGILDTTGITRTRTTRTADNLQDIIRMKSTSTGARTGFDYEAGDVNGILMNNVEETTDFEYEKQKICDSGGKYHASTTRDFLGLSGFSPKDLIDVGGFDFDTVIRKGQR